MEFKTLSGTSIQTLTATFNEAFSDYLIPIQFSEAQLKDKMKADKTDLAYSVGAFEGERLVGFILHGYDFIDQQKVLYNGGTGVIPAKRGAGLTKRMYQFMFPILQQQGINRIVLEVIIGNDQAIKSYEKVGFKAIREVVCFKGALTKVAINEKLDIKLLKDFDWSLMESFWDILPTWQNSKQVINGIPNQLLSFGAYWDGQLVGYVIFHPTNHRIHQLAVSKDFRRKRIASSLLLALKERFGENLSIINIDKGSSAAKQFFTQSGLESSFQQIEMELLLK